MEILTLKQFIEALEQTVPARKQLTRDFLSGKKPDSRALNTLRATLDALQNIPRRGNELLLQLETGKPLQTEAEYEITELEKDLMFFEKGEDAFYRYLAESYTNFQQELNMGFSFLEGVPVQNFITDRDGTVNNYCARYNTSIQPAYNAVFLSRYASRVRHSILLTSAPLRHKGLADISVLPDNRFILAGSKGREYLDTEGQQGNLPISRAKQEILDRLNHKLSKLLAAERYAIYTRIGSGLQLKFGQTTIARQDINHSISDHESAHFLEKVTSIVRETDPEQNMLVIEDTGLDIEIILTTEPSENEQIKDFNKGDGISFLNKALELQLHKGPNLICGDTASDIPMIEKSLKLTPDTLVIFVTTDKNLQKKVKKICKKYIFVSKPDILITLLGSAEKHEIIL
ncbi:MAG: hypothetical protein R6U19_09025 [Bacteroidales bacterium]